jgi:N-acetylmuramoyl-L-alanine amidase
LFTRFKRFTRDIKKELAMRKINKIIVHCTATQEGKEISVETIRGWHVNGRGWSDIGYHYIIGLDGLTEVGRPIERPGAHTKGENKYSIGITYVGGVEAERGKNGKWIAKDTRTKEQKISLLNLLTTLKSIYGDDVTIHGHREFAAKSCPCFDAYEEYKHL